MSGYLHSPFQGDTGVTGLRFPNVFVLPLCLEAIPLSEHACPSEESLGVLSAESSPKHSSLKAGGNVVLHTPL